MHGMHCVPLKYCVSGQSSSAANCKIKGKTVRSEVCVYYGYTKSCLLRKQLINNYSTRARWMRDGRLPKRPLAPRWI